MVQSTKSWTRNDFHLANAAIGSFSAAGCLFVQAQMSSIFMIVPEIISKQSLKVPLVEHDDMVEQVSETAEKDFHSQA
ncbi:MAG: hypothetical protein JWO13_2001 [Acidobacteriales bacterium]|nr:hypothetical protein [Terriglobales bacterium]